MVLKKYKHSKLLAVCLYINVYIFLYNCLQKCYTHEIVEVFPDGPEHARVARPEEFRDGTGELFVGRVVFNVI